MRFRVVIQNPESGLSIENANFTIDHFYVFCSFPFLLAMSIVGRLIRALPSQNVTCIPQEGAK